MRLRRILLSIPFLAGAALVALYALGGFVAAPAYLERAIPRFIEEKLHAKGEVAAIRINPFLFTFEMRGFRLGARHGEDLVSLERLFVDFEASSLLRWAWTFDEIALEKPALSLRIDPKGELNIASLVARLLSLDDSPAKPAAAEPKLPRVLVRKVALAQGRVSLFDQTNPKRERAHVENIALEVQDVSTLPGRDGGYAISAKLPGEGSVAWRGKISLAPIASEGEFEVKALRLARVAPFSPIELRLEEPAGVLDLGLRYRVSYSGGQFHISADNMSLAATGIELRPTGAAAPILQLAEAKLQGGSFDLNERRLGFAELVLRGGRVAATLDESGTSDWERIVVVPPAAKAEPAPAAAPAPAPTAAPASTAAVTAPAAGAGESWKLTLAAARIEDFALRVADESRVRPLAAEIARADMSFAAAAQTGTTLEATIDNLAVALQKISLGARGAAEPLVVLEEAKLEGGGVDLGKRSATVAAVRLAGGAAQVVREADGRIALLDLLEPKKPQAESGAPFAASVGQASLERFAVRVADKGTEPPVQYDVVDLQARVTGLATAEKKPLAYEVAAKLKQGGGLRAVGNFDLARLRADAKVAATRIALAPLEPLVTKHATLKFVSGSASADGRVTWDGKAKDLAVTYKGSGALEDVLFNDLAGKRLFGWKAVSASGVALDTAAARATVEEVRVLEPVGTVIVDKERNLNLAMVLRKPPAAAPAAGAARPDAAKPAAPAASAPAKPAPANPAKPEAPMAFAASVDRVRVEKGDIDFADQGLVLPFAARVQDLNGAVTGLSTDPASRAATKMEGRVDEFGLARVEGTVSAFAPKSHMDLAVVFRNVNLPPMSPYSATFAGRMIATGRVSLDLQYKINNSELQGENKVVLEQFTLGERVESPGALNLPLDLAIALLTDSEGRINVEVPVRGNVDSPEFGYGHLIWQAIRTVITNIVTAPFRALGSLFGSGAPPENIAFDAGSARLLPPEREKLVRVAKTMQQRPQLKVMVQGSFDAAQDGRALREAAVRATLAERLELKPAPGDVPAPIPFDNAKVQRALEALLTERAGAEAVNQHAAAFEKQAGRKPDRVNPMFAVIGRGSADRQFYESVFQRLVELQPLAPAALQDLARRRSETIVKELAAGGLPEQRTGQKEPEAGTGGANARLSLDVLKAPS